jgi:hypothetical protein
MTHIIGSARAGCIILLTGIVTAALCGDADARGHKRHLHGHRAVYESRAQLVSQQPAQLAPMRYCGGPKSPMWR